MTTPTTPMETPTPETDAEIFRLRHAMVNSVSPCFARKLERERDALSGLFQEERSLRRIEREAAASENEKLIAIIEGQKSRDEDYLKLVSENAALSAKLEEWKKVGAYSFAELRKAYDIVAGTNHDKAASIISEIRDALVDIADPDCPEALAKEEAKS